MEEKDKKESKTTKSTNTSSKTTTKKNSNTKSKVNSVAENNIKVKPLTSLQLQRQKNQDAMLKLYKENFNIEPDPNERFTCILCKKYQPTRCYHKTYGLSHGGTILPNGRTHSVICKTCSFILYDVIRDMYHDDPIQAMMRWCYEMNIYFNEDILKESIKFHNSDSNRFLKSTAVYIGDYMRYLSRHNVIGMSFWDSPYLNDSIKGKLELSYEDWDYDLDEEKEEIFKSKYPIEFAEWEQEDLDNYDFVCQIYKYDPFKDEPLEDRRKMYYNLAGLSDETIGDDFSKANAAIDTCRSMQRLDKLNKLRIDIESKDDVNPKDIKAIADLQKIERDNINKNGKEHGFIQKYSITKGQGSGTFTGIVKKMNEEMFEDALINAYDIKTSVAMQQAAEASWKGIFSQLNLSDSEFSEIVKQQREVITKLRVQLEDTQEKLRLANIQIKKEELQEKLDSENGGEST